MPNHDKYALTCQCEITRHTINAMLERSVTDDEWRRFATVLYEDDLLTWWGVPHPRMTDQRMFRMVAAAAA